MAKKNHNEPWLLITFVALTVVVGVFYAFLFPNESLNIIIQYWHLIVPTVTVILILTLFFMFYNKIIHRRQRIKKKNKSKQLQLAEQLIWRGRYSLESQKFQIVSDDDPESREKWQALKEEYIRSKLYPVVSEREVPINIASALIENTITGNRYRKGRLPTYGVDEIH